MSNFCLYPVLKSSFELNSVRKNFFLSECFCGDFRLSLLETDQKEKIGETIGCGDSYLEFSFRLHAKLHDAAGAVRAHSGRGLGYCYRIGRGPNWFLFGHVTGLLFPFTWNPFCVPFSTLDFWFNNSCVVLDIEHADINVSIELGVPIDGKVYGYSFRPPNPQNEHFDVEKNRRELSGTVGIWITVSFPTFVPQIQKVNTLQKEEK